MRTLIISDLHLGQRPGHDVLRHPAPLQRLLAALDDVDRLVLLGDVVELGSRLAARRPLAIAAPVLRAIGARMGPEREIVLVVGNHDALMLRTWTASRGRTLGIADDIPPQATPALAAVTALLAPARVRVSYPGVWLGDGVWATHGHYLDRHLVPESTFGLRRGRWDRAPSDAAPSGYERARRRRRQRESSGGATQLRERPVAVVLETLAELTRYATALLQRIHLTAITSALIDLQMRKAALPAMATVAERLGVGAAWVVFGHVHRLGPAPGERWQIAPGGPRLLNTGSWIYEPLLLDRATPPHPYWPGGAVRLETGCEPAAVGLLDDLTRAQLGVRDRR